MSDYGFVLLARFVANPAPECHTTRELSDSTGLPLPTVSKLLKMLAKKGILTPHRGVKGGYSLTRDAREISAADVLIALEGSHGLTDCADEGNTSCAIEESCPMKPHWQRLTKVVHAALSAERLADLCRSPAREPTLLETSLTQRCGGGHCLPEAESCTCGGHHSARGDH